MQLRFSSAFPLELEGRVSMQWIILPFAYHIVLINAADTDTIPRDHQFDQRNTYIRVQRQVCNC
jgi:hypothetical protein